MLDPCLMIERSTAEAENRPKSAHRYNVAEQQLIYKSEIERIWKAQFDSLSRKTEPELTAEDEAKEHKFQKQTSARPDNPSYSRGMSPALAGSRPSSPSLDRGLSMEQDREGSMGPDGNKRVLRIKRLVRACRVLRNSLFLIVCSAGGWYVAYRDHSRPSGYTGLRSGPTAYRRRSDAC